MSAAGFTGWIFAQQRLLSFAVSLSSGEQEDGAAMWSLFASRSYGGFHAVGPVHGKAVDCLYLVAH